MTDREAEKIAKARLMAEDMATLTKPKTNRKLPKVRTK
jgi:hypothetical protein